MRKSIYGVAVFSVAFSVTLIGQVQPPTTANGILEITAGAGGGRLTIDGSVVADVRPNAK